MTAEATVVIKGRSELGQAVRQAEQQLKGLVRTGDLVGKLFRGGAIIGAVVAFERLAKNAEAAATSIGDKGTAKALHQLNSEIDKLKSKGINVIGQVLGGLTTYAMGSPADKAALQIKGIEQRIGQIKASVGQNGVLGPGLQQDLAKLEKERAVLEAIVRLYGPEAALGSFARTKALSRGGGSEMLVRSLPPKTGGGSEPGLQDVYIRESLHQITTLQMAQEQAFKEMDADAKHFSLEFSNDMSNGYADTARELEALTKETESSTKDWTSYADQAARDMFQSLDQFLFDPFHDGLRGMLKGFVDMIRQMVATAAATEIFNAVGTWASGSSYGWLASLGSAMMTGKASGGPVSKGHVYTVGERGRETFVPSSNGYILPNGAGGGVTINQHIDASGADADRIMAIMPSLLKQTKDQTIAEIRDLQNRGRL